MKNNNDYAIIMAGGVGKRFWPLSKKKKPKQFLDILGIGKTLIQQTFERLQRVFNTENIYVITHQSYYTLVKEQLPLLSDEQILLEPLGKNTAPCITYSAMLIHSKNPKANLLYAPADHLILKEEEFTSITTEILEATRKDDMLATIGIKPTRPATGYGYIQLLENQNKSGLFKVKTFTEKPNLEIAKQFLDSGDFLWNSGIFIWRAKVLLDNIRIHIPDLHQLFKKLVDKKKSTEEDLKDTYYQCTNISIDYGLLEKADNVYVKPGDLDWTDLGTWKSVYETMDKDENENIIKGRVLCYDTNKSLIISDDPDKLIVVQGLENHILVDKDDTLLLCKKEEEQKVKEFLEDTKAFKDKEFD